MGAPRFHDAADLFAPLEAGSYVGRIEPGAFFDDFTRNGARHCSLGLRLEIGEGAQRVVRVSFLLKSEKAIGVMKRDVELLARWTRLVGAPPARSWFDLSRELWVRQEYLGVDLAFDIRPAPPRGRGYVLNSVRLDF